MKPNNENLREHAVPPLTQWLIHAAKRRSSITYGEAQLRLEKEIGFSRIGRSTRMGVPAGALMDRIWAVRDDCPPVNVLLVRQDDRLPGKGVGGYMAKYLNNPRLKSKGFRDENRKQWQSACDEIATAVYAFNGWGQIYAEAFGERLPDLVPSAEGSEKDGIRNARGGEGPNHEALRLWVKKHPRKIRQAYASFRTDTEVVLDSADRVDVVYYGPDSTVVIEVKSSDSNDTDLRRGVFQCIKYRAVMAAMDIRLKPRIEALLVTQRKLPSDLRPLLRLHNIRHFIKAP